MNRSRVISGICASAIFLIFMVSAVQTISEGKEIFLKEGCISCHSFKGHGGATAPDLTAVGNRRSTFYIMAQIKNPQSHNPDSRMPKFGDLTVIERYAIARYLKSTGKP
jgi:cbb3-type cytochrome oxidase cytochrome c subunit